MSEKIQHRVIRRPELIAKTGMPCSSIYQLIADGQFPKPIRLGNLKAVGWIEAEVDGWINVRMAEREVKA